MSHCFRYPLPDLISTCPVTQCVHSPSLHTSNARTHTHPLPRVCVFMDNICSLWKLRGIRRHKEERSQRPASSSLSLSLRSSESRCRLRKSRKEFDVLVDGGSSITVDGSERIERGHVFSLLLSSATLPSFFYCCLCDPSLRRVGSNGESSRKKEALSEKQQELVNGILWRMYSNK